MPSFEHSNSDNSSTSDNSLYQPGKNRDKDAESSSEETSEELIPTTQHVTYKGDVAAEAELEAAAEAARKEQEDRPPRYIDEEYGDPAPTIQQSIRIKPQPKGPRKPGLRGRNRSASEAPIEVKGGGSFGEVEAPTAQAESLSGNRVVDGELKEPPARKPRPEKAAKDNSEGEAEATTSEKKPEDRPRRKRNNQRKPRNQNGKPEQGQGKRQNPKGKNQNNRPNRKPKPEPKKPEEPKGLFDKLKKTLSGIFGGEPKPEPKPEPKKASNNRGKGQAKKRPQNHRQHQNKNQGPNPDGEGPRKPRRRRGGRGRGGRNRNRQNPENRQTQGDDAS